ncbi:hypothetical protein F2Q70_00018224 [Brassica cretica]|nr:hypothetical protein F2Q70_00018224 [Brassica cretica]
MRLDYSYTQPSESEDYGLGDSADSGYSLTEAEFEADILLDQAEIEASRVQYPPQPEVEFGFPKECYCGGKPLVATSYTRNDPGRRYYTCENVDDGDCHVWKWWDVAVKEEMRAMGTQVGQLAEKVDHLAFASDYETYLNQVNSTFGNEIEQKIDRLDKLVLELGKKKTRGLNRLEFVVAVMVFVLVVLGMVLMFK